MNVITQQEKAYETVIATIKTVQDDFQNARKHPFLSEALLKKLNAVLGEVMEELSATKNIHDSRTQADEIQQAIGDLFENRVGANYPDDRFQVIFKDGERRYAERIPPGFKDDTKEDSASSFAAKQRKYGDLIIWSQLMDKAKEIQKGIILVTDDRKEDWWLISGGKTLSPRPELIAEFSETSGQSFYMYQADRFFEFAAEHLKQKLMPESVDEIRDLSQHDASLLMTREEKFAQLGIIAARNRMDTSDSRMAYLRDTAKELENLQKIYQKRIGPVGVEERENLEQFLEIRRAAEINAKELDQVRQDLAKIADARAETLRWFANLEEIARQNREWRERNDREI